jgi:hypothetical protein
MAKNERTSLLQEAKETAKAFEEAASTSISAIAHSFQPDGEPHHEDVRYEQKDINLNHVLLTGISLLIVVCAIIGLLYFYFSYLSHYRSRISPPPLPIEKTGQALPPEPRLQPSPRDDLREFRAREDEQLTHYHWVNQAQGVVSIPIERAIEVVAQRGIPPQKAPAGVTLSKPQEGSKLTGFEGKVEPEPR